MSEGWGRPKRSLGQNFLVDPNYRRKIVQAIPSDGFDRIVEIGPGRGALTEGILERAPAVVVIEKDAELARSWIERARSDPRLTAIEGDVLDHPMSEFGDPAATVAVGNIPYNVTTPILFHLLQRPRCLQVILMVQREVADRIVADPGTAEYGALSVGVRSVATVERLFRVPGSAFRPRPRVESTVVRIVPDRPPLQSAEEEAWTRHVTRAAFQWRRKQLGKILRDHGEIRLGPRAGAVLDGLGVAPQVRPEALSPDQFVELGRLVRSQGQDGSPP